MRILIVDDEVRVAHLLADAVNQQGHEAIVAHRGATGLLLLGEACPDAVFLDVRLQDMSGIEVLRRLRVSQPALPVILISGRADADEIAEARRLGVTDIIAKPHVVTHLSRALDKLEP